MQIRAQFLDQRHKSWLRLEWNFFKVQRYAFELIAGQVQQKIRAEGLPRRWIVQKIAEIRKPLLADLVKVIDQRKDFNLSFFRAQKRHYAIVSRMDQSIFHHLKWVVHAVKALQMSIRAEHMQPFRKKKVDLRIVLFERDKTRGVPINIIGRADTFIGIQHHLRWRCVGFAVRPLGLGPFAMFALFQGAQVALLLRHEYFGQRVRLYKNGNNKEQHQCADDCAQHAKEDT